ncbi:plasmid partitioning protein RepB C-terminal domain-containing protein [Sinorhizobium fredii]|uniref:plasmid partitioning protein RepB C-terminal domain-containing protein n=1 Tax=Rhizobium fredii TaxID=380 RepID=UPI0005955F27|nr:plasmid partitioning protein RepB C-terminal domain-containing protein [Sinorhizobium fredii]WOS64786.1 plasmid partitioning protein RepB C-terminal domain-containing protein [Sinorhizobium fredii GR64]
MEIEAPNLDREFKTIEQDYEADHLALVPTTGYVARLIGNARVVGYLTQKLPEILAEFSEDH